MKKLILIIILLSYSYSTLGFAISIAKLIPPPPVSKYPASCPSWKTIAQHLDVSDIKIGPSPYVWTKMKNAFYVEKIADHFSTPYQWYFVFSNITAASKEEALKIAKNILNTSADSPIQSAFISSFSGGVYTFNCKLSKGEYDLNISHSVSYPLLGNILG